MYFAHEIANKDTKKLHDLNIYLRKNTKLQKSS